MDDVIPDQRANRDFRVKFPDDVLQENLAGQLWFGAECLAAGSSIMNREVESASMRPLAKAVTKTLDNVRNLLKEQCLRNPVLVTDKIREALRVFDRFFAEFELSYVSAMVPVKTMREYDMQQEVIVLFSETLYRALQVGLMTQEMVDDYDPALMFTIPRLAIICGLLVYPDGPLNVNLESDDMSEMFKPFRNLLRKIRDVLWSLNKMELNMLEKALCNVEEPGKFQTSDTSVHPLPNVDDYVQKVCADYPSCKQFISTYYNFDLTHVPLDEEQEEEEEDESVWMHDCNSGEELLAFQESLSNTLTKVIERSGTRDSGLHSDSCSNASESSHNLQCMVVSEEEKCVEKEVTSSGHSAAVQDMADQTVTRVVEEIIEETVESLDGPRTETTSRSHVVDKNGAIPKRCNATAACDSSPSRKVQRRHLHRVFHSCPSSPYNREQNSSDLRHVYSDTWVYSSSGSSCRSASSSEWDSDCCSSDTSSYNSECQDDEEIALAIQAAEIATRSGALGRFRNTEDLVHRLFVCIAGVADQLQTNHASDLRNILKFVFQMNCTEPITPPSPPEKRSQLISNMILEEEHEEVPSEERISVESAEEANENSCHSPIRNSEEPPQWIPDDVAPECMSCRATFNVVRRRHHCRNCGKVFCSKCSSNSVPLPHYGHSKPVRVCDNCFLFQVASFLINDEA